MTLAASQAVMVTVKIIVAVSPGNSLAGVEAFLA